MVYICLVHLIISNALNSAGFSVKQGRGMAASLSLEEEGSYGVIIVSSELELRLQNSEIMKKSASKDR